MADLSTVYLEKLVTAAQLRTAHSSPVEILPAPGPGWAYAYRSCEAVLAIPTTPYPSIAVGAVQLIYGPTFPGGESALFEEGFTAILERQVPAISILALTAVQAPLLSLVENKEILLTMESNITKFGAVLTSSVGSAGADYEIGDEFTSDSPSPGGGGFTGEVATIDGAGAVLTYTITDAGFGLEEGQDYETNTDSADGDGFELHVTTITPNAGDATLSLRLGYVVLAVS